MKKRRRRVIKLTREDGTTRNAVHYAIGETVTARGGGKLCTAAYLHAYRTAREAVFFRSLHDLRGYDAAWLADAVVEREDDLTKLGCTQITLRRRVTLPTIDTETLVTAAILCALDEYDPVLDCGAWGRWAETWLSGRNRSANTARAAANAYARVTNVVVNAAANAATYAYAAARATDVADVADVAADAADAADVEDAAAYVAADAATRAERRIDALLAALGVPPYGQHEPRKQRRSTGSPSATRQTSRRRTN